ncbi:MAG TPA: hypothetical protein VK665_07200 [Candidatus Elarobacter sp.]|nr:hypothetical protein [Candidatus Elarobacter sp.]
MRRIDPANVAPPELRAPNTPKSVVVTLEAARPFTESDLGIAVRPRPARAAKHRLVTLGDSLTHGFQSGAIFNTDRSWPAQVAAAGGFFSSFLHPHYDKYGGLPLNLEYLVRELQTEVGGDLHDPFTFVRAVLWLHGTLADICHYWQDGDGAIVPKTSKINHDLATYGYDLRDALSLTPQTIRATIAGTHENKLVPLVTHGKERAALRTLPYNDPAQPKTTFPPMSALEAAKRLGAEGIETLTVFLGANNVLGTTFDLHLAWSDKGYDKLGGTPSAPGKDLYNIWRPEHFAAELALVARAVRDVGAQHVIWATVPHVTIVPLLHGIGEKMVRRDRKSRYFPYYSRPWFDKNTFDPERDPRLTGNDARTIDSAIDQYNDLIADTVAEARRAGLDWRLLDLCGVLDRLASRRYIEDAAAQPSWWKDVGGAYPLPPPLAALTPKVDSKFFLSSPAAGRPGEGTRTQGGLFSLDGVHPTTVAYGIMAHETLRVMREAGITGYGEIDFAELLKNDSLLSAPPAGLGEDFAIVGWLDAKIEFATHLFGRAVVPARPSA